MNPISRIFIVLFSWLCLSLIIAILVSSGNAKSTLEIYVPASYIAPLIVVVSFSIDLMISGKKWKTPYKTLKIIIAYTVMLGYVILNYKEVIMVLNSFLDVDYWAN